MNKYSLVFSGVLVSVLGTFLVDSIGLTESCSTELTSKAVEYAPILVGGIMATIGRWRLGGVSALGFKE